MSVTVAGGLDAVRAEPDAIRLAGAVLDRTAAEIDESRAESSTAYWALWTVASLDAGAASLGSAQDALDSVQRTLDEAAAYCRLSNRLLWGLINDGTLPASRIGRKLVVSYDALDEFLRSRPAAPRKGVASA